MSLFDFFFPEQAQAMHLRDLASQNRVSASRKRRKSSRVETRVKELEDDLGYVTLILGAFIDAIDKKGVVTREDLKASISEVDAIDGVRDGKLDIDILKGRHS